MIATLVRNIRPHGLVKVRPREVFAAGLALIIISYNNFPQKRLEQKHRFLLRRTAGNLRGHCREAHVCGAAAPNPT
jgi:hypothetical protein